MSTAKCKALITEIAKGTEYEKSKFKRLSRNKQGNDVVRVFTDETGTIKITILESNGEFSVAGTIKLFSTEEIKNKLSSLDESYAKYLYNSLMHTIEAYGTTPEELAKNICDKDGSYFTSVIPILDNFVNAMNNKSWQLILPSLNNIVGKTYHNSSIADYFYSKHCEKAFDDADITVDGENTEFCPVYIDGDIPVLECYAGGDWEHPVTFFLYFLKDEDVPRFYIPEHKYNYHLKTKTAYGSHMEAMDDLGIKYDEDKEEDFFENVLSEMDNTDLYRKMLKEYLSTDKAYE